MMRRIITLVLLCQSYQGVVGSSNDDLARKLGLETLDSEVAQKSRKSSNSSAVSDRFSSERGIAIITEPFTAVTLAAPVIGQVEERVVEEGVRVKKGQVVLILENRSESIETDRLKIVSDDKAGLEASRLREEILKNLYESSKMLYDKNGSVSFEELQKSELDYQISVADRKHLEVQEQQEALEHELALSIREKRFIKSPIAGIITRVYLKEGEGCEVNQPLVKIVDATKGLVIASVDEVVGREMEVGQRVTLRLKAGSGQVAKEGTIFFVSPVVDAASSLMEVKVEFDNRDGEIRLGVAGTLEVN